MLTLMIIWRAKGLLNNARDLVIRVDNEGKPIKWLRTDPSVTGAGVGLTQILLNSLRKDALTCWLL
jgi:hypothetical protein